MQNLFLLPTKKPSRLHLWFDINGTRLEFCELEYSHTRNTQHIYITSDEEIKEGDWVVENHTFKREPYVGKCFYPKNDGTVTDEVIKRDLLSVNYEGHYETLARKHNCKKIILTTDPDLIEDGVQTIDDEFLEWFIKNPSCKFVEISHQLHKDEPLYKIIIPQEEPNPFEIPKALPDDVFYQSLEPKQETLEEPIKPLANFIIENATPIEGQDGAYYHFSEVCKLLKLQSKKMYSEEDCYKILHNLMTDIKLQGLKINDDVDLKNWFEKVKKK